VEFRILGPLEVVEDGRQIDLGGAKQRALLAILLLHANQVVSTDRLMDALWEDGAPETGRKALQVYVSQLRKVLGKERLQTKPPGYLLRVARDELDLERFQRLVASGEFREGLSLWRGPAFAEFVYQRFAETEIGRLEDLRLECIENRIDADLAAGRHSSVVSELEALVKKHPLREGLRSQLMLALDRSGRQAEALEVFQEGRGALVDDLGIEPSRGLRELERSILRQDPALELEAAVDVASASESRGVFVGRERELAELLSGLEDVLAGRGRLFLLVGEPGIGKSRLADELIAQARARRAQVLVGRCWEAGGAPSYWPWVQSLRAYVREAEPETLRTQLGSGATHLAQLLPEVRELFPDLPELPSPESEAARFQLFEAVTSFLSTAARTRPLVLVLDDLHAADEPSLLLLQFLARELGSARILVVGALRDVDPPPTDPLTTALTELARERVTRTLALAGLGEPDVARCIELLSGEAPSERLVATIYEETEGNPLFVGEIVRLLAAEGGLDREDSHRPAIAQSVRHVISRRLRHLSPECNRVLVLASVLGREFAIDALARASALSEDKLLEILDEAMTARVVSDVPGAPSRLRFAHVLIRDTLYESLTMARRVGCTGLPSRHSKRSTARNPGRTSPSLPTTRLRAASSTEDSLMRSAPEIAHLSFLPTKRPRACTTQPSRQWISRATTKPCAASFSFRSARPSFGRETACARKRPSSQPRPAPDVLGFPVSLLARRRGTAVALCLPGREVTSGWYRYSRRDSPHSRKRTSNSGQGFWPA
jgi:DNA-binding SARP family transcriptional activator